MAAKVRKVPINCSFTTQQVAAINRDAKRLEISFADCLRRIVDEWRDKHRGLAKKLYGIEP